MNDHPTHDKHASRLVEPPKNPETEPGAVECPNENELRHASAALLLHEAVASKYLPSLIYSEKNLLRKCCFFFAWAWASEALRKLITCVLQEWYPKEDLEEERPRSARESQEYNENLEEILQELAKQNQALKQDDSGKDLILIQSSSRNSVIIVDCLILQ